MLYLLAYHGDHSPGSTLPGCTNPSLPVPPSYRARNPAPPGGVSSMRTSAESAEASNQASLPLLSRAGHKDFLVRANGDIHGNEVVPCDPGLPDPRRRSKGLRFRRCVHQQQYKPIPVSAGLIAVNCIRCDRGQLGGPVATWPASSCGFADRLTVRYAQDTAR